MLIHTKNNHICVCIHPYSISTLARRETQMNQQQKSKLEEHQAVKKQLHQVLKVSDNQVCNQLILNPTKRKYQFIKLMQAIGCIIDLTLFRPEVDPMNDQASFLVAALYL